MIRVAAERRREDFVNAAVRVIAEHGAPSATTRLIAEKAEAPLATLHYCYDSKEALFGAVFDALAHRPYDWAASTPGSGLAVAAVRALERAVAWYTERPDWARARMELFFWAVHADDGEAAVRAYDVQHRTLREVLAGACSSLDDVDLVESATHLLIALIDGLLLQWLSRHDPAALRDELDRAGEALALLLAPVTPAGAV